MTRLRHLSLASTYPITSKYPNWQVTTTPPPDVFPNVFPPVRHQGPEPRAKPMHNDTYLTRNHSPGDPNPRTRNNLKPYHHTQPPQQVGPVATTTTTYRIPMSIPIGTPRRPGTTVENLHRERQCRTTSGTPHRKRWTQGPDFASAKAYQDSTTRRISEEVGSVRQLQTALTSDLDELALGRARRGATATGVLCSKQRRRVVPQRQRFEKVPLLDGEFRSRPSQSGNGVARSGLAPREKTF